MKVCIVSTHFPSDDAIGEYCGHMATELCKRAKVIVIANKRAGFPQFSEVYSHGSSHKYEVFRVWKAGVMYPFTIFRSIVKQKPDIVHFQHEFFLYGKSYNVFLFPLTLLLLSIIKIPKVVTMHHVIPQREVSHYKSIIGVPLPEVVIKAFLIAFNGMFRLSSKILVPSDVFKKTLLSEYKIAENIIDVVQHFTDSNNEEVFFQNSEYAKTRLGFQNKKMLLFFGYIRPQKGIEYVLHAMPYVIQSTPNVVFSIAGKAQDKYANYFDSLEKLVDDLGIGPYVRFENHIPDQEIPTMFSAADAVVYPYTSTLGTTPIAHLKAAFYGKPIVASKVDGFSHEFVDHENALLVPPRDADALCKSIVEIFTNDDLSRKLSVNIRKYCAQRSSEKAVDKIVKIYNDLIGAKRKRLEIDN